jgi:predicted phage replisome organizer
MASSDVQWIKLSICMFDDEKIKLLEQMPDYRAIQLIWVKLICHAGKTNSHGYIFLSENMPYTIEQLAMLFREPPNTIELALISFEKLGMITRDGNGIFINNFEKHQTLDKLARIRELDRERVSRFRQKVKELPQPCNVTVTLCNATEESRYLDKSRVITSNNSNGLPEYVDETLWNSFLEMRKKAKSIPTDKAKELLLSKLNKLKNDGNDPNKVLEQSIMNGWKGLFPLKDNQQKGKNFNAVPKTYENPAEFFGRK